MDIFPPTARERRDRTRDKPHIKDGKEWNLAPRHKTDERTVIGIDGEGHNAGSEHIYDLLAASTRESVSATDGLSTRQCFEFLLSLKHDKHTRYTFVGFSLNYDINMWLRDLPRNRLEHLFSEGHVYWHEYALRWKQNRTFSIYDRKTRRSILIYDVFGFFQCAFVKALRDWKVGDAVIVEEISEMKERRGTFTVEDAKDVREYCFKECELLVQLMQRLINAVHHAEIPCSQWYGVGALASGLLKKHKVKQYLATPPESMRDPILCAYFGGRFEIAGSGHFGKIYGYDIKSAYPSVARSLPCLVHTKYIQRKRYKGESNSLLHVEWKVPKDTRFGPFPLRYWDKRIYYPLNGRGWYWSVEVDAAMRLFPGCIRVVDTYIAETTCADKPFDFINDVYAIRRQFEAAGDYAHKALKLSMNAIYGKTAQSLGNKEKIPPYQSYIWAGMITAGTRAVILDAIRESNGSVVSIATDGIASTMPIDALHIGKELGDWEHGTSEYSFFVQPGIYRLANPCPDNYKERDCEHQVQHTRGFGRTETDYDAIEKDYARSPVGKHVYKATRFVGAASAMAHREYKDYWRKWIETERVIHFSPSIRFPSFPFDADPHMHDACTLQGMPESTPYEPKQTWWESFMQDVDLVLDFDSL